jgi:hypothetical protein
MWKDTYVKSMDAGGSVFVGKEWIKVSTESKRYADGPQATITLAGPSDVYLLVDDRWPGTPPAWLAGWTSAGFKIIVDEPPTRPMLPFAAYKKTGQTGDVDLPKIGAGTAYNYFVVVD